MLDSSTSFEIVKMYHKAYGMLFWEKQGGRDGDVYYERCRTLWEVMRVLGIDPKGNMLKPYWEI